MAGYAVAHLGEIEEFADAGCHYRPIRHHLGITAFGVTAWTARAAVPTWQSLTATLPEDGLVLR
jgi:hypothetical protein